MPDELRVNDHQTLRVLGETAAELELEGTWIPGGSAPPAHLHPAQDEQFEVTSGHLTVIVGGQRRQLGPGDTLEIPKGTPHKMWNDGDEVATALWRTRPAGRTADWFRTIDRLAAHGTRKPSLPALAKALTEYGDVFRLAVGPGYLRPVTDTALRMLSLAAR
jgi:quercetin dioxygenase-like cupin family protein